VVAIGEALWDVFPDRRRPGGAPCNVAFHAARLGDRGVIVTRVGADALGAELIAFLSTRGVVTDFAQRDDTRPTGTVSVTMEGSDPRYAIAEDVAWDHIAADDDTRALVRSAKVVCVGSLAQRSEPSRSAIQQLLSDAGGHALVVFDVNLRPPFVDAEVIEATLRVADVVKMGEAEAAGLSSLLDRPSLTDWLLHDAGVQAVCVTRGEHGASMTTRHGTTSTPGIAIDSSTGDAVGAGDAFTAAMAHHLVRGTAPDESLDAANRYAALVATKAGAMPVLTDEEVAGIGS
jgi:fructokinase